MVMIYLMVVFFFFFFFFAKKLSCFEYNEDVTPFKLNSNQSAELIKTSSCLVSSVTEHIAFSILRLFLIKRQVYRTLTLYYVFFL